MASVLYVDERIGSKELVKPLTAVGLPAEITHLDFGDVAFLGRGESGASVDIGIELKTLGDCISSLRSGRLAGHQLPGLVKAYEHVWLVVEGYWRHDEQGRIITFQGKNRGWRVAPGSMQAGELEKQLLTLEMTGGLHVRYTNSRRDTVRFLCNLYRWWTDNDLSGHRSHLRVHHTPTLIPISSERRTLTTLPGLGIKAAGVAEKHFMGLDGKCDLVRAFQAPVDEWAELKVGDKRLGTKIASKIYRFVRGRKS